MSCFACEWEEEELLLLLVAFEKVPGMLGGGGMKRCLPGVGGVRERLITLSSLMCKFTPC